MREDSLPRDLLIAYAFLPFLTPSRTRLLLEYFDPLTEVCNTSPKVIEGLLNVSTEMAQLVRNPLRSDVFDRVVAVRNAAVTLFDDAYPAQLKEIIDPPLALFFRGDLTLLQEPSIAIVGSRRASPYAINAAELLARQLSSAGLTVVSGLARGIDAAAHRATLEAGGKTIAVLGTGIDVVYPPENGRLMERLEAEGLIVTEFAPGTPPYKGNFPIRNRVISGLTAGTVIVEATSRSGSLITARTAAEQGREVFAVPGSIFSPGTEGTHRLIQYGAKLVHDSDDILLELPDRVRKRLRVAAKEPEPPDSPLREVLEVFNRDEGTHIDDAATKLRRPIASISEPLLQLELGGWIRALPGSRYVRTR